MNLPDGIKVDRANMPDPTYHIISSQGEVLNYAICIFFQDKQQEALTNAMFRSDLKQAEVEALTQAMQERLLRDFGGSGGKIINLYPAELFAINNERAWVFCFEPVCRPKRAATPQPSLRTQRGGVRQSLWSISWFSDSL